MHKMAFGPTSMADSTGQYWPEIESIVAALACAWGTPSSNAVNFNHGFSRNESPEPDILIALSRRFLQGSPIVGIDMLSHSVVNYSRNVRRNIEKSQGVGTITDVQEASNRRVSS